MEPQHGFSGADANAPLQAKALTLIGALKVQTTGREEERRACTILCACVRCERSNDQTDQPRAPAFRRSQIRRSLR